MTLGEVWGRSAVPPGRYEFDAAGGRLSAQAVAWQVRGVRGIVAADGSDESPELTGTVRFAAGAGIRLTANAARNEVRVDAVGGEFDEECPCEAETGPGRASRRSTAGARGPTGDFRFDVEGGITVTGGDGGLVLEDRTAEPCCSEAVEGGGGRGRTGRAAGRRGPASACWWPGWRGAIEAAENTVAAVKLENACGAPECPPETAG